MFDLLEEVMKLRKQKLQLVTALIIETIIIIPVLFCVIYAIFN